jgi:hypothetical protein
MADNSSETDGDRVLTKTFVVTMVSAALFVGAAFFILL